MIKRQNSSWEHIEGTLANWTCHHPLFILPRSVWVIIYSLAIPGVVHSLPHSFFLKYQYLLNDYFVNE